MREETRCRRIMVIAAIAATVAALAGVALAQAASPHGTDRVTVRVARTQAQNHQAARRDAARLLSRAPLPASAARSTSEPRGDDGLLGSPIGGFPAGAKVTDDHAYWTIPAPLLSVREYVVTHAPAGSRLDATGDSGGPGEPPNASLSFAFRELPAGITSRSLAVGLVALGPDLTAVRVDAQAVWLVPRPAAERVPPGVRTVRITLSSSSSGQGAPDGTTLIDSITDRSQVTQIARWIDALAIVQPGVTSCPSQPVHPPEVRFTFLGASPGARLAVATENPGVRAPATVCDAMSFMVAGRVEPALLHGAQFLARVDRLLRLHLTRPVVNHAVS